MDDSVAGEFPGVTPQLTVPDADVAARFYRAAFGADELLRNHGPDGRVMHCELLINGGRLLLHDDYSPGRDQTPLALGGTPVVLHLYVADVDATFAAALEAGATAVTEPRDMFWGDRYAQLRDPFGHQWSLATPREELSVADQEARGDQWADETDWPRRLTPRRVAEPHAGPDAGYQGAEVPSGLGPRLHSLNCMDLDRVAAGAILVLFVAGVLRDRRSFANAVLLGLGLALLALGTAERLARAHDPAARLVLLAIFVLVALGPFVLSGYLVINGVTMVRRESMRPANLLSLLAGVAILAVTGFEMATPLVRSDELALSATIVMLLFGYVSFQCGSFVLYAFLYGRLPMPRHAGFVVVLGSGLLDGGRVPPLLASRLDRGYSAYQALAARGCDPVLIVSGAKGGDERISEAEAMEGYLTARGFPAGRIQREDRSANTQENLTYSKAIMDRLRPGAACVIVTSNYHVFRTAMIARRVGVRGQVTGARTVGYYWPSATLREFAAVFLGYKAVNLAVCFLLVAVPVATTLLHHAPAGAAGS